MRSGRDRGDLGWTGCRGWSRLLGVAALHPHEKDHSSQNRGAGRQTAFQYKAPAPELFTRDMPTNKRPGGGDQWRQNQDVAEVDAVEAIGPVRFGRCMHGLTERQQPRLRGFVKRVEHQLRNKSHGECSRCCPKSGTRQTMPEARP